MFLNSRLWFILLAVTMLVSLAAGCSQEAREQFIQEHQQEEQCRGQLRERNQPFVPTAVI